MPALVFNNTRRFGLIKTIIKEQTGGYILFFSLSPSLLRKILQIGTSFHFYFLHSLSRVSSLVPLSRILQAPIRSFCNSHFHPLSFSLSLPLSISLKYSNHHPLFSFPTSPLLSPSISLKFSSSYPLLTNFNFRFHALLSSSHKFFTRTPTSYSPVSLSLTFTGG